jgi:hypothetical protein
MHLVVLEDRGVSGLLPVESDVEYRVEATVARKHPAQLALLDTNGVRLLPAPVENAGDHPFAPQAARIAGSPALALAH